MMKKILDNKKQILASILAVGFYFIFSYTNIFGKIFSQFRSNSPSKNCVAALNEELQSLKFIFSLAGVPEAKTDAA